MACPFEQHRCPVIILKYPCVLSINILTITIFSWIHQKLLYVKNSAKRKCNKKSEGICIPLQGRRWMQQVPLKP
jgi:hypothetical protein